MLQILQNVFIELPKIEGGFGFTLQQNAFCKLKLSLTAFKPLPILNPLPDGLSSPAPRPSNI